MLIIHNAEDRVSSPPVKWQPPKWMLAMEEGLDRRGAALDALGVEMRGLKEDYKVVSRIKNLGLRADICKLVC